MFNLFRSKEDKLTNQLEKQYLKFINRIINEHGVDNPLTGMFIESFIVDYTKELKDNVDYFSKSYNMSVSQFENIIRNAARNAHRKTIKY